MTYQTNVKKIFNAALIAIIIAGTLPTQIAEAAPACPLTAGAGEIVVNFNGTSLVSNTTPHSLNQSATILAGTYTVTAVTWDNHTGTTETDQTAEKVHFIFKDSTGEITRTSATDDIPATQNFTTSNLGSRTLSRTATTITVEHSAIGTSNHQSVTPLCIKLTGSSSNNLAVSCRVSDTTIDRGDTVDFTADVTGGVSPFTYDWDWDIDGDSRTESRRFNSTGNYQARITVTDNAGRTAQSVCPTIRVSNDTNDDDDLNISCRVSDTTIEEGDTVTYSVDINDGNSPYEIEWDGAISGDDETERVRYNRNGTYEVDVTVRDENGDRDTDTCPVVRVRSADDNGDDNRDNINVITRTISGTRNNTPTGTLASLDAVFLSQVPYTGPKEILTLLGVLAFVAIWSTGAALYFKKRRAQHQISARVQAFKELNKTITSV